MADIRNVSYLALGDSYTIGECVDQSMTFPYLLASSLESNNIKLSIKVIAKTGWTSTELENAIEEAKIDQKFDLVTLLIGVNNQYRNESIEDFKKSFIRLIAKALNLVNGDFKKLIIISIPDYGYTPFGYEKQEIISKEIDKYNAESLLIAEFFGLNYINVTDISRQGLIEPNLITSDGLHPSSEMYKLWISNIESKILSLISDVHHVAK